MTDLIKVVEGVITTKKSQKHELLNASNTTAFFKFFALKFLY